MDECNSEILSVEEKLDDHEKRIITLETILSKTYFLVITRRKPLFAQLCL